VDLAFLWIDNFVVARNEITLLTRELDNRQRMATVFMFGALSSLYVKDRPDSMIGG
jgi:hypothetical protein